MTWMAELLIDGNQEPMSEAGFLFQRDPFPGDHRYSLRVASDTGKLLPKLLRDLRGSPDSRDAKRYLGEVEWLLGERAHGASQYRFLINSVEEITSDVRHIHLVGVCSTILKTA